MINIYLQVLGQVGIVPDSGNAFPELSGFFCPGIFQVVNAGTGMGVDNPVRGFLFVEVLQNMQQNGML